MRTSSFLISILLLYAHATAAEVTWTGGLSGFWDDASNWSSVPFLPGASDDVTIDTTGLASVFHDGGSTTIQSLDLSERLMVRDNSHVIVTNDAILQPGSRLEVADGSIFTAGSIPSIDGVDLEVSSSLLPTSFAFPTITSVTNLPHSSMNWSASGSAASIDLSQVTTLTHSTSNFQNITVSASMGAQIDLSGLVNVIPGNTNTKFQVTSNDSGSFVDISNLTGIDVGALDDLTVGAGGNVAWPNPVNVSGLELELGGTLATSQIASFTQGKIISTKSTSPDFANVSNIDGTSLEAGTFFDVGVLSLPSATTFTNTFDSTRRFLAENTGSLLDLSSLTSVTGSSSSFVDLEFEAVDGGQLDLSSLTSITRPGNLTGIRIESSGAGSNIDFSAFTAYTSGALTSIRVLEAATMDWTNPVHGDGIDLEVGGTLTTTQIESWTNGEVKASNNDSAAPSFSNLSNADGSSLIAGTSVLATGNLSLPSLVNYEHTGEGSVLIQAVESGSTLDVSALQSITLSDSNFRNVTISANRGGQVNASGLTTVNKPNPNTSISVEATGTGSSVDISALQGYEDSQVDDIRVERGSSMTWSNPTTISGLTLEVGGTIATSQITTFANGTLAAINAGGTSPDFSGLTNANGSNLLAGNGITSGDLSLPQLLTYENSNSRSVELRAISGSVLDLSATTSIRGSTDFLVNTTLEANQGQIILNPGTLVVENDVEIQMVRSGTITVGTLELRETTNLTGEGTIQGSVDLNGGSLESGNAFSTGTIDVTGQLSARNGGLILIREDTTLATANAVRIEAGGQLAGGGLADFDVDIQAVGMLAADDLELPLTISGTLDLEAGAELSVTEFYFQDRASLSGEFLLAQATGGVNGTFSTLPAAGIPSHMDRGYFLEGINQTADSVSIDIYAAIPGDANGDKVVDVSDFNIWNANKFTLGGDWTNGDFNDDGAIDVADFNLWNANKFTAFEPEPATVPEPGGFAMAMVVLVATLLFRRSS